MLSPLVLSAASPVQAQTARKHKIVTTTGMVTDIVRTVVGEKATVEGIIGEGIDPHLYQATRSDIAKLLEADIIFYNGLMLEGKMSDALIKVARKRPVYPVTELIDEKLLLEPPEFAGHFDPHVWMDASLWSKCTESVANAMGAFDPSNAEYYLKNYREYAGQLEALDAYAKKVFATIPEKSRVLITAHDAFNYMGRRYAIEVRGIQGISTESEAGISDINRLVDLIVDRDVKAVFVETSVSNKNVESLVEGAKARAREVRIGGKLFSDAMGKPGTYEGTYIGMIDHNVTIIARALGGDAPERGMQGKLAGEGG
jgi:manganese/zinc/iron transport system substrate-binding protein